VSIYKVNFLESLENAGKIKGKEKKGNTT